jgi:hypothetical protein
MAIVRCEKCGLDFSRTKQTYHRTPFKPVGYPNTAAICGLAGCTNPGLVWLQEEEYTQYGRGERFFSTKTYTVKVKVE